MCELHAKGGFNNLRALPEKRLTHRVTPYVSEENALAALDKIGASPPRKPRFKKWNSPRRLGRGPKKYPRRASDSFAGCRFGWGVAPDGSLGNQDAATFAAQRLIVLYSCAAFSEPVPIMVRIVSSF